MSLGKLSDLCGRGSSFILPSYDALVEAISGKSPAVANYEVGFHVEGPRLPAKLQDAFKLRIEVRNLGNNEIPDGARLFIEGGQYFPIEVVIIEKPVPSGDTRVVVVDLKPKTDASVSLLPEYIEFRLVDPSGQAFQAQNARFPIHLRKKRPDFLFVCLFFECVFLIIPSRFSFLLQTTLLGTC